MGVEALVCSNLNLFTAFQQLLRLAWTRVSGSRNNNIIVIVKQLVDLAKRLTVCVEVDFFATILALP